MIEKSVISQLKKTNVSVDREKTKDRIAEIWRTASKEEKQSVLNMAGVVVSTVFRIYNTGSVSAKIVLALAQVLDVSPYYLTGKEDEKTPCTEELSLRFLREEGYDHLISPMKSLRTRRKRKESTVAADNELTASVQSQETSPDKTTPIFQSATIEEPSKTVRKRNTTSKAAKANDTQNVLAVRMEKVVLEKIRSLTPDTLACVENLQEEDVLVLAKSMLIRAKAGGDASVTEKLLKLLLLQ